MNEAEGSLWCYLPYPALYKIFQHLTYKELISAGAVCKLWLEASRNDLLWRDLFYKNFLVDKSVPVVAGKTWYEEFKRLCYKIPIVQTEILSEHTHQVLHVSFSHNGRYFATCSKDGYVTMDVAASLNYCQSDPTTDIQCDFLFNQPLAGQFKCVMCKHVFQKKIAVWNSSYPATEKYSENMKHFKWKYTQYSQFNETDTLLLVSGVHFGTTHSTSGEIAVFNLDGFKLQCRVVNKPYDIFGTWYSDQYLLSGDLHWLAHLVSSSHLWLNRATQEADSELVPITHCLFRFYNRNASSIRAIMIANCLPNSENISLEETEYAGVPVDQGVIFEHGNPVSHRDMGNLPSSSKSVFDEIPILNPLRVSDEFANPIWYNSDYRKVEAEQSEAEGDDSDYELDQDDNNKDEGFDDDDHSTSSDEADNLNDKYLIFTTGNKTYTPHQIGFKRIKPFVFPKKLDPGPTLKERLIMHEQRKEQMRSGSPSQDPDWLDFDKVADKFDKVDHLIDLHGHIVGMGLSPDHRFLYVNSRSWPENYVISNPLDPPPIAQEIDIHVIDLVTLKQVGTMLRAHKAYTPNNECFFTFLDVCNEYVASGAEDKHGYMWDRHYGICLAKYPHLDIVNSVAFNPKDPEMLVTTSDDFKIKIWRSRSKAKELGLDVRDFPTGIELRKIARKKGSSDRSASYSSHRSR